MASNLGFIFGALLATILVSPLIIFSFIMVKNFDVDGDEINDY